MDPFDQTRSPVADKGNLDDRIAIGVSRFITRRAALQTAGRWLLTAGVLVGTSWRLTGVSRAAGCSPGGVYNGWGCYCADTPGCGTDRCCPNQTGPCCHGAEGRCDFWTDFPFCWCSNGCCLSGGYGYYSCCDCWKYGRTGGCGSGNTKCVCKHRHVTSGC